ncbi:hypothetical protein CJF30_00001937 [Rutstroemia sp. NJR-2017a BBW]|nr:hypothetical protein CJF30_00001937 [Rutstroemia sp. NJR-2017a BBW]
MSTRYRAPTVESIIEDSEDDSRAEVRGPKKEFQPVGRQHHSHHDFNMSPTKGNAGRERERERERERKMHKSTPSGSKHHAPNQRAKHNTSAKRESGGLRRRHAQSDRYSSPSSSSSEEEDDQIPDHKAVLEASRARLTSPSVISNLTCMTSTTNKSSSSSGSNSTITQASMFKRPTPSKDVTTKAPPQSPAVPSPPNVFAYLQNDSDSDSDEEEDEEEADEEEADEEDDDREEPAEGEKVEAEEEDRWLINPAEDDYTLTSFPSHTAQDLTSSVSSASSSLHSDGFSEPAVDFDTDRSTSPEISVRGREDVRRPTRTRDHASIKIATQMAAANQRQNYYGPAPSFGTPSMHPTSADVNPLSPSDLTPRNPHPPSHYFPRIERPSITGYELLASKLSDHSGSDTVVEERIKPMYRKFEALNHRLLLHLQDEISELEEQLHRVDAADTEARRRYNEILPASRRAAAEMGGELQWHKIDILGRIGYKLAQYNQTLTSFHATQNLSAPSPADVSHYRDYLHNVQPIAEIETRFLDPADDLVSVCSSDKPPSANYLSNASVSSLYSHDQAVAMTRTPTHTTVDETHDSPTKSEFQHQEDLEEQNPFPTLAIAIAVSVLIPILTFNVIPTFLGRMTVVCLVASGVVGALMQSNMVKVREILRKEGAACVGVYMGTMVLLAAL